MWARVCIEGETYEIEFWYQSDDEWEVDTVFLVDKKYDQLYHKSIDGFVEKWKDILVPAMRKAFLIEQGERKLATVIMGR